MKATAPVLVLLVAVLAWACTPQAAAPPAESDPVPQAASSDDQAPVSVPARPVPAARAFDESILKGREFLLDAPSPPHDSVRDVDLGELNQDSLQVSAVERFFQDAADGSLSEDHLEPRWAAYLNRWAAEFKAQGWSKPRVRVGANVLTEGGALLVAFQLSVPDKRAQGWLALVRDGEDYRVSDVQWAGVPLRTTPFDPETSAQEISSPSLR